MTVRNPDVVRITGRALLLPLLAAVSWTWCAVALPQGSEETLRLAYPEPSTLHNLRRRTRPEHGLCKRFLFPPLLDLDPVTLELVPALAAALPEIEEEGRRFRFRLRDDVYWHRRPEDQAPVPVSTTDVLFSWERLQDPASDTAVLASVMERFRDLQVIDARTFEVELEAPYFRAMWDLGHEFALMPAHCTPVDPEEFRDTVLGRRPIGYGPYRLDSWVPGSHLTLVRNPAWPSRAEQPWSIERFQFLFVADAGQYLPLFQAGELHLAPEQEPSRFAAAVEDPSMQARAHFVRYAVPQWNCIAWNQADPRFSDERVRRALSLLCPTERAAESFYGGEAERPSGPWSVGSAEADPDAEPLGFDRAEAERLLEQAGCLDEDGDGVLELGGQPMEFTLLRSSTVIPPLDRTLQLYAAELRRAGILMTEERMTFAQVVGRMREHSFEAAQFARTPPPRDDDLFPFLHSSQVDGGNNFQSFEDPECDALLEAYRETADRTARLQIAHALHRLVAERCVYTYLPTPRSLVYVSRELRDVEVSALGIRLDLLRFAD